MLRNAFAITSLIVAAGIATAPGATADPPYRNCKEAHADGRYNIHRLTRHTDRNWTGTATVSLANPTEAIDRRPAA